MKEEKTKSKKSVIYYVILAVCAALIITATVLTVYFVTRKTETIAENPPVVGPDDPNKPGPDDPDDPDKPSSGDAVKFVVPVEANTYSMAYAEIVHNETVGWWYRHKAIDFNVEKGTDVLAMADGTVTKVSYAKETGNLIVIDHGDGISTSYRFVEPIEGLGVGEKVTKGQKIAEVAEAYGTEAFAGEHLHLEMFLGKDPVDPADYVDIVLEEK